MHWGTRVLLAALAVGGSALEVTTGYTAARLAQAVSKGLGVTYTPGSAVFVGINSTTQMGQFSALPGVVDGTGAGMVLTSGPVSNLVEGRDTFASVNNKAIPPNPVDPELVPIAAGSWNNGAALVFNITMPAGSLTFTYAFCTSRTATSISSTLDSVLIVVDGVNIALTTPRSVSDLGTMTAQWRFGVAPAEGTTGLELGLSGNITHCLPDQTVSVNVTEGEHVLRLAASSNNNLLRSSFPQAYLLLAANFSCDSGYSGTNCDIPDPTTPVPSTPAPTTPEPTTPEPTTPVPTTQEPTTPVPTTPEPTTPVPTTQEPTTPVPTTQEPTTPVPTTQEPTARPTSGPTQDPTTPAPTTTPRPTSGPTTPTPTTPEPTTPAPTTPEPTTPEPTTPAPTTPAPTTPTTQAPTCNDAYVDGPLPLCLFVDDAWGWLNVILQPLVLHRAIVQECGRRIGTATLEVLPHCVNITLTAPGMHTADIYVGEHPPRHLRWPSYALDGDSTWLCVDYDDDDLLWVGVRVRTCV